jgi:hypothetical protein
MLTIRIYQTGKELFRAMRRLSGGERLRKEMDSLSSISLKDPMAYGSCFLMRC